VIAPNDNPVGRNDPCPCGSGLKYKHCCMGTENDQPHLEPKDMKTLLTAALLQIAKLTRTPCFIVPEKVFEDGLLEKATFEALYDPNIDAWKFAVRLPEELKPKVIGPRRIVLPNQG